jgi:hypothetical protein
MKLPRPLVLLVTLPILFVIAVKGSPPLKSQSTTSQAPAVQQVPEWQRAAGGKMAFDVASVKVNKSGSERGTSNITGFNVGPTFLPTGGLF